MNKFLYYYFIVSVLVFASCGDGKIKQEGQNPNNTSNDFKKTSLDGSSYRVIMTGYDTAKFTKYYQNRIEPPKINLEQSLETKSISDLVILKNSVLAMKGNLFEDATLAAHFSREPWYQPPFWNPDFSVELTEMEKKFFTRLDERIFELQKENYTLDGGKIPRPQNIVNLFQWTGLPEEAKAKLAKNGFVIEQDSYTQPFTLYEQNAQQHIPSLITTDLILNQMHIFYGELQNEIEEQYLFGILQSMLETINKALYASYEKTLDPNIEKLIEENLLYYSIPYAVLTNKKIKLLGDYNEIYFQELQKVLAGKGQGSKIMGNGQLDFGIFAPTGHYVNNEKRQQYFKALTWLQNVKFCINNIKDLDNALLIAYIINNNPNLKNQYSKFVEYKSYFSSHKPQFTLWDMAAILAQQKSKLTLETLFSVELRSEILGKLQLNTEGPCQVELSLLPQDHQNLYNDLAVLEKGLPQSSAIALFAALDNPAALELMTNETKSTDYEKLITDNLANISGRTDAISMDWISTLLTSYNSNMEDQEYMQQNPWKRKELNTALAGWAMLSQRPNLGVKKAPKALEKDSYTPTVLKGYVEPNLAFWKAASTLLANTNTYLVEKNINTEKASKWINELERTINFLAETSKKEIEGATIDAATYHRIAQIGTECHQQALHMMDQKYDVDDISVDGEMAYATMTFQENKLNTIGGTGPGQIILAMVEIDGFIYLTRGAVYSFYELNDYPKSSITSEEWKALFGTAKAPQPPVWIRNLMINGQMQELTAKAGWPIPY